MTDNVEQMPPPANLPAAPQPQKGKAVAKARLEADGSGVMAIIPRSIEEASRYAQGLIQAGQVPDAFRYDGKKANDPNPALVLMGVLKVLELDLPPQTGLAFILPLNGRFTVWGDGAWALLQRHGQVADHKVEWINKPEDWDRKKHDLDLARWPKDYGCRVSIWRKGQASPYIGEFTVGDAIRAGLWNSAYRKPWIQSPERMIFNRARAFPMRDGFADALLGLGIAEEAIDIAPPPRRRSIDNSALDDDLPIAAGQIEDHSGGDLATRAETYKAGLAQQATLEDLEAYQTSDEHRLLIASLQKADERLYQSVIMANAHRYQEIEASETRQRQEADEASDAEAAQADPAQGDLLGDGGSDAAG